METLVNNLAGEGLSHFKQFTHMFKDQDTVKFLLRKNAYYYDYIDSYERFVEPNLPPREAFYNRLKKNIFQRDITLMFKKCGRNLT